MKGGVDIYKVNVFEPMDTNDIIYFYRTSGAYGCFSNFYPSPIVVGGKEWPTTEHYFQAMKFKGTPYEEEIRNLATPMIAAAAGRDRTKPLRKDWEEVKDNVMYMALFAKFTQHANLRSILTGTDNALLVEHTHKDRYWADGGDGTGKNMLGKLLMRVRDELKD